MIVAAASNLRAIERLYLKWGVYTCSHSVVGALTGFVAAGAAEINASQVTRIAVAVAAGGLTAEGAETLFTALTMRLRGKSALPALRILGSVAFGSLLLYAPLVGLLVVAYLDVSPLTLPLFLLPALAAQRLFRLYQDQRRLADDLASANGRLDRANLLFATALVSTL